MDFTNDSSAMRLVEEETGAVMDVEIRKGDKVTVIRKEQIEAKKKFEADTVTVNGGRRFVKQFPDLSARLCERLSPNAVWLLSAVMPYVGINSGILRFRNGNFLKSMDIVKLCARSMSERTAERTISELCRRGVFAKCTVENKRAFIVNPYVMQNGSRTNATLLALFKDTEWFSGRTSKN